MRYLLDTDFVIDYLTGLTEAHDALLQFLPDGIAISIITFSEIYEGIYGSRDPRQAAQAFTEFCRGLSVLPINRSIAKLTAQLRLDLRRQGHPITHRALDLFIASTALEHELTLVTRNRKDYQDIARLSIR